MLYIHPHRFAHHLANAVCALFVGCVFAFVGLNAASGCGQPGGACIHLTDLAPRTADPQVALAAHHLD